MNYNKRTKTLKLTYIVIIFIFVTISLLFNLVYVLDKNKVIIIYLLMFFSSLLTFFLLNKSKNKKVNEWLDLFIFVLNGLILVFTLTTFILLPSKVDGTSMEDTFKDGQRVYVNLFNPNYEVNDVVVHKSDKLIIKRIVALKGDIIELRLIEEETFKYYLLYINNEIYFNKFDEEYRVSYNSNSLLLKQIENKSYTLKENEVILLGDNSSNSLDSRQIGILNTKDLIGKVMGKNK